MSFKKTLALSVFLHIGFFAAALLLSADLLGRPDISGSIPRGSSKMPNEKVLFVKLIVGIDSRNRACLSGRQVVSTYREDITISDKAQSAVETKKTKPEKSRRIKAQKNLPLDIHEKAVSVGPMRKQSFLSHGVETDVTSKNNNYLNTEEEPADNILLTDYETGEHEIAGVSYGQETAVNIFYGSFSSKSRGTSEGNKGRGVLPAGIFELIKNSIERVKTYPFLARKRGLEGTVRIRFRVNPQGIPQNLKILKSSGYSILDTATLNIVKKAAPFPYVESPIELPVVFNLN